MSCCLSRGNKIYLRNSYLVDGYVRPDILYLESGLVNVPQEEHAKELETIPQLDAPDGKRSAARHVDMVLIDSHVAGVLKSDKRSYFKLSSGLVELIIAA